MFIFFRSLIQNFVRFSKEFYRNDPVHAWILLLTFLVTFGYALFYQIPLASDARGYYNIASNVITTGTYCLECTTAPLQNDRAIFFVGPGYQFFLVGVFKIFGMYRWVVWLLQALMHTAVVAMLWAMIIRFVPLKQPIIWWQRLPILLYTFHPDIVQLQGMIMTEPLFLFCTVSAVYLLDRLLRFHEEQRPFWKQWMHVGLLGCSIGALFMVRPTGAGVLFLTMAFLFWKRYWRQALVVAIIAISLQIPWTIRNYQVFHRFILNSTVGGVDMWVGLHPDGNGEWSLIPDVMDRIKGLTADEREYLSMREVKNIIITHPGAAFLRIVQKGFKLFGLTKTSGFWFHYIGPWDRFMTVLSSVVFNVLLLSMGFAALWEALRRKFAGDWMILYASCLLVLMVAAPILTVVTNRYRLPALPAMVLLAAYWLVHAQGKRRWQGLLIAGLFLFTATGVDLWGNAAKVLEHIERIKKT